MSEEERLEKLSRDIEEVRETLRLNVKLMKEFMIYLKKYVDIFSHIIPVFFSDFVCADPHGTWNGHLPGAYDEGDQIKNVLTSKLYHDVTMMRHPVSKADFLANLQNRYIVHLAGHGGVSNGQVMFCFDDGDAYPSDISALTSVPTRLFYAGVCLGGSNDTMANVFRQKGTKYYVGFTQTIPDWDAKYFDDMVYEKWLIDGKDLRTALDEADDYYPSMNCWVLWE